MAGSQIENDLYYSLVQRVISLPSPLLVTRQVSPAGNVLSSAAAALPSVRRSLFPFYYYHYSDSEFREVFIIQMVILSSEDREIVRNALRAPKSSDASSTSATEELHSFARTAPNRLTFSILTLTYSFGGKMSF